MGRLESLPHSVEHPEASGCSFKGWKCRIQMHDRASGFYVFCWAGRRLRSIASFQPSVRIAAVSAALFKKRHQTLFDVRGDEPLSNGDVFFFQPLEIDL